MSAADRAGAAAQRVHPDAPRRRGDHEAQAGGAAQHRHRSEPASAVAVRLQLSGGVGARLLPPVSGGPCVRRHGAGVQRPAPPAAHAQVGAALPSRLRRRRSRGAAGLAALLAMRGDVVGLPVGVLRRAAARLAQPVGAGEQPGGGGDREGLVQTSSRTGCTGRVMRGATSHTARASSARRKAGAGAIRRCRRRSASRCWRRSWRWRPSSRWRR